MQKKMKMDYSLLFNNVRIVTMGFLRHRNYLLYKKSLKKEGKQERC